MKMLKKSLALFVLTLMMTAMIGSACLAEIIPPYGEGQIGLSSAVLCEKLTLREAPSSSSKALQTIEYGHHIIVMELTDEWAYCVLGDAEDSPAGWVNADYIAIDPAWYRTEGKTPVYAWNDTKAPKVALLDKDITLPILKEDGDWLIVSLRGAVGWIHK